MEPIKPKYKNFVKAEWKISKRSKQIINLYSKYTKYDESEILDKLIADILNDKEFVDWLNKKRYKKRIQNTIDSTDNGGFTDGTFVDGEDVL